jgi:hypothetical protein
MTVDIKSFKVANGRMVGMGVMTEFRMSGKG